MKQIAKYITVLFICSTVACVPARKFEELQVSYDLLQSDYEEMRTMKEYGDKTLADLQSKYEALTAAYDQSKLEGQQQMVEYKKLNESYEAISQNYQDLKSANELTKKDLTSELQKLDKQLDEKKRELFAKESTLLAKQKETAELKAELDALEISLKEREKRVNELEAKLAAQEKAVTDLKDKLTESLIGYQNSGISVVQKDGKIYVSLDNSLLFKSGKTDIDWKGKTALLKVAESLKDLEDFDIMVEGHTDDVPMKSATIQDNWDLSVLRATSVVRYLTTEGKLDPKKIIPSGRSKYIPVNEESTSEARAQNRRIEIILTPKLDQLMEIIK